MRRFFESELDQFRSDLTLMGQRTLEMVELSLKALLEGDVELAERVRGLDNDIDRLEIRIDDEGIRYLTLRAPVTSNLRLISFGMKTSHDIERIADEAVSIARHARALTLRGPISGLSLHRLPEMGSSTVAMLRDILTSLFQSGTEAAMEMHMRDARVDVYNRENYEHYTQQLEKGENVASYLDLIFISKSLERIGDHTTNIAEEIVFLQKFEDIRHSQALKEEKREEKKRLS